MYTALEQETTSGVVPISDHENDVDTTQKCV